MKIFEITCYGHTLQSLPCPSVFFFFNINLFILFIYFWLRWVFVDAHGLSLVAVSGSYCSLWWAGFSLEWLLLLQSTGSGRPCASSCGTWAQLLRGMWNLPGPGLEPVSPALAGGFFFFLNFFFIFYIFNAILVCLHSFYVCMYVCMAVLGLRFCVRVFSSCGKRGPLFIAVCGPLTITASRCRAQAPDAQAQ